MEIILLENIKNLGQIGDVVVVKRGFGRNFLIKYGKALMASDENMKQVSKMKEKLNKKNIELKKNAKKIHDVINEKIYTFLKKAKDNDELYGSVKPKEISIAIDNSDKIQIRPAQIDLSEEINKIGFYSAKVNLHPEVQAKILIKVVKEEANK